MDYMLFEKNDGTAPKRVVGKKSMFLISIRNNFLDTLKKSVEKYGVENENDALNWSYLHYAAYHNNTEAAQILLDGGLDINTVDIDKQTALFTAIKMESLRMVEFLLKNNIDLSVEDVYGFTAFELAKTRSKFETNNSHEKRIRERIFKTIDKYIEAKTQSNNRQKNSVYQDKKYIIQKMSEIIKTKVM